jgi:hypothetical protein
MGTLLLPLLFLCLLVQVISRNLYVVLLCMILFLLALASAALWVRCVRAHYVSLVSDPLQTIFMFRGDTGAASTWGTLSFLLHPPSPD